MTEASEKNANELTLLLADLTSRQQEIVERGRSENYLFVLYFTALGSIVAAIALLQSNAGVVGPALPTIVLVGALAMLALPVDQVHLAYGTELRRVYIQQYLQPRLRTLYYHRTDGLADRALLFEDFDRETHKGWFNALIPVRAGFVYLPSAVLFTYYLLLRSQTGFQFAERPYEVAMVVLGLAAIVINAGAFFRMLALMGAAAKAKAASAKGSASQELGLSPSSTFEGGPP